MNKKKTQVRKQKQHTAGWDGVLSWKGKSVSMCVHA